MDGEETTRLETLVRALDEVIGFHEQADAAPLALVEELRANRARLVRRIASPAAVRPGDEGAGTDDTPLRTTTCVSCEQRTDDPDRDGWHVFSDGSDEQHVVCADCAATQTRGGLPIPVRIRAVERAELNRA
jgi:hypothetical protein